MAKNKKSKKNNKVLVGQTVKSLTHSGPKGNLTNSSFRSKLSKPLMTISGVSKTGPNGDSLTESNENEGSLQIDDIDHSLIREPINLGVKNVRQILTCIKDSTLEVKDLILNECNIIYECKICTNLFRSLVNFIAHKRIHCKTHFCERMLLFDSNHIKFNEDNDNCDEDNELEDEDLTNEQHIQVVEVCNHSALEMVSPASNSSATNSSTENINPNLEQTTVVSQKRKFIDKCIKKTEDERHRQEDTDQLELHLTTIKSNPNAVFQRIKSVESEDESNQNNNNLNKKQIISELVEAAKHSRQSNDSQAIKRQRVEEILPSVESDIDLNSTNDILDVKCDICDSIFMSTKTLRVHMRTIHSTNRLVYPCPLCSLAFKQLSNATRHLIQVHKRSKTQANNLKEVMKRRAYSTNCSENSSEVEDISDDDIEEEIVISCERKKPKSNSRPIVQNENRSHSKSTERHAPRIHSACIYNCGNVFDWAPAKRSHEKSCKKRFQIESDVNSKQSEETNGASDLTKTNDKLTPDNSCDQKLTIVPNHTSVASSQSTNLILPTDVEEKIKEFADLRSLGCSLCPSQDFMNLNQLLQHAVTHIGYNIYKCHGCSYHSIYEHDMKYHLMNDHNINEDMIGKHYQNLPNLTQPRLMILPIKSKSSTNGIVSPGERESDPQSPDKNSKLKIHLRNMGNTEKKCYEIVDK